MDGYGYQWFTIGDGMMAHVGNTATALGESGLRAVPTLESQGDDLVTTHPVIYGSETRGFVVIGRLAREE